MQAEALGLAGEGPGSLLREGRRVLVEVEFEHGALAADCDALRASGAEVVDASRRYQTVTVAARPGELRAMAAVPRVSRTREVIAPITSAASCPGKATSEGDSQLGAAAARADFGVDGSGVDGRDPLRLLRPGLHRLTARRRRRRQRRPARPGQSLRRG